jgi:tetratricopeptide (TPR) repeat protein
MTSLGRTSLAVLLALSSVVHADAPSDKERSKRLWLDGAHEYSAGHYAVAITRFEDAYRLDPNPNILYNLALAYRKADKPEEALAQLRAYLKAKPQAANRTEVEATIAELEATVAKRQPAPEPEPAPPPPVVAPPPPAVALATDPASTPRARAWYQDPLGWSLVGGGVAAAAVGAGLMVHAGGLSDEANQAADYAVARDRHDSAQTFQTVGLVVLGVGGAAVAAGVAEMLLGSHASGESPRVGFTVGPGGLAIAGRY